MPEHTETELKVPEDLRKGCPWLTLDYVERKRWYATPEDYASSSEPTPFGMMPKRSREEFRAGDVIVFQDYEKRTENGKLESDRFIRVTQEDIDAFRRGERSLLPVGVVVHAPSDN